MGKYSIWKILPHNYFMKTLHACVGVRCFTIFTETPKCLFVSQAAIYWAAQWRKLPQRGILIFVQNLNFALTFLYTFKLYFDFSPEPLSSRGPFASVLPSSSLTVASVFNRLPFAYLTPFSPLLVMITMSSTYFVSKWQGITKSSS